MAVDVLSQPLTQRPQLAGGELVLEVADVGVRALPQLPGDEVAQGVGGEVPDQPRRPVHVLQHAVGVIVDGDAEVLLKARVPCLGQVADGERPIDQALLELEAQDDVQRVGGLVGLDADVAGLDPVDRAVERGRRRGLTARPPASAAIRGASTVQNERPRPTMFSHRRLWDSCMPSDSVGADRRAAQPRAAAPPRTGRARTRASPRTGRWGRSARPSGW